MLLIRSALFNLTFVLQTMVFSLLLIASRPFGFPAAWFWGRAWSASAQAALRLICGVRLALAALKTAPPEKYSDQQWEALEAIVALLKPAVAELRRLFAERGEVDFTEIAHGALLALGTPEAPTDLLLALDVRVKHLLVDEFQDTSNSQWELIERLTAGWEPGDGRTVFVVGDPMQSIYRFRDAQVGLFLHARRHGGAQAAPGAAGSRAGRRAGDAG